MKVPLGPHLILYTGTLGPQVLLYQGILRCSRAIIWRNLCILISYYMEEFLGSQVLLYTAAHRSAQGCNNSNTSNGIDGIDSVQRKNKLKSFEKLVIDSNSATLPNFDQTL